MQPKSTLPSSVDATTLKDVIQTVKNIMVVSSTLVNVAEDAELRLVGLLAEAAPSNLLGASFQTKCEANIAAGDATALLQTVVNDPGAILALMELEESEASAVVSLLAALLQRVKSDEVKLARAMADAIVKAKAQGQPSETAERKVSLLSVLYNMRSDPKEKCALLNQMIVLAGNNASVLLSPVSTLGKLLVDSPSGALQNEQDSPQLVAMLDAWKTPASERRLLYRSISSAMPTTDKRKQRFLLLLTDSYKSAAEVDADGVAAAKDASIGAIRDPVALFIHQRTMLSQPAIQALEKKEAKLFGLLKIFQEGKLSDYEFFMKANGGEEAILKSWGLDVEGCKRHIRILSLCSLASEDEEIPYSAIADTLKLPSQAEVESWVIAAVSSGLLQAKMDQLTEKVMVERCVVRRFDMDQWKILQKRLSQWKSNVHGVLSALKQSQLASA